MSLLLQLNGDLPSHFPDDERRLHIFCCKRKACSRRSGSVRALREVKRYGSTKQAPARPKDGKAKADPAQEGRAAQDLGAALFGRGPAPSVSTPGNPFALSNDFESTNNAINPFASVPPTSTLTAKPPQAPTETTEPLSETFASKLKISSTDSQPSDPPPSATEPWPSVSLLPPPYPHFHLDADYETLVPEHPTQSSSTAPTSKAQYDIDDSTSSTAAEKDTFESSLDATFLRFSDRLAQNPSQVLRYEFNGTPLLYSGSDAVAARFGVVPGKTKTQTTPSQGMPRCESCGARRVFELQLVPGLISAFEEESVDLEEGMEWGTIILGVCTNDCGEVGKVVFREEWVGVQWEERVVRK